MSTYFWLKFVLYFQYVHHVYLSFSLPPHSPILDTDNKGESDLKPKSENNWIFLPWYFQYMLILSSELSRKSYLEFASENTLLVNLDK